MEHRCSVRKPFQSQLLLYKHGLPVQSGVCTNLGLGGVFVVTDGVFDWRKNEYLEVEFVGVGGPARMRLPAVVVHHGEQGAGLMFGAMSNEQRRRLRVWLFKRDSDTGVAAAIACANDLEVA